MQRLAPRPSAQTSQIGSKNGRTTIDDDLEKVYKNIVSVPSYSAKIAKFLKKNQTHSLHRRIVKTTFPRRRVVTHFPFQIHMADLMEFPKYKNVNKGYKYIMIFIDCFTKKIWISPMKSKNMNDSVIAMDKIIGEFEHIPNSLITDAGTGEFINYKIKALLDRYKIHHYTINSKLKAMMAERVIRTIKERLSRYFTENNTKIWIDVINNIVSNYNKTPHSSTGVAQMMLMKTIG